MEMTPKRENPNKPREKQLAKVEVLLHGPCNLINAMIKFL